MIKKIVLSMWALELVSVACVVATTQLVVFDLRGWRDVSTNEALWKVSPTGRAITQHLHGGPEGHLYLDDQQVTPDQLETALQDAGVDNPSVVATVCYPKEVRERWGTEVEVPEQADWSGISATWDIPGLPLIFGPALRGASPGMLGDARLTVCGWIAATFATLLSALLWNRPTE